MRYGDLLKNLPDDFIKQLSEITIETYQAQYPELIIQKKEIIKAISEEQSKFAKALKQGIKQLIREISIRDKAGKKELSGKVAFNLFSTYSLPLEMIKEQTAVNKAEFWQEFKKHQEISRAGAEKKFGGVGSFGDQVARQHTATHLLQQALRQVLGDQVKQAGSDLTPDRLRFDFTHPKGLTDEEKKQVEKIINEQIAKKVPVERIETSYDEAIKMGALAFFKEKYGEKVSVYKVGNFSQEVCGGPHVKNTAEIGSFKIISEKSAAAGIRRIKAVVDEK